MSNLATKTLTTEHSEEITFAEAFNKLGIRKIAISSQSHVVPDKFREFVLRKYAVSERGCRHFEKQLHPDARNYLKRLIGLQNYDINLRRLHSTGFVKPNCFLGVLVRYFFKKLVFNKRSRTGRFEYAENYAEVFPFRVSSSVPLYDEEVINLFNDDFYAKMRSFLDEHFDGEQARSICRLFLANIRHFQMNNFSEEALLKRLQKMCDISNTDDSETSDYLDTFLRLNESGIKWFKYLYNLYKIIKKIYYDVDESVSKYDDYYFQTLPESNFADLYSLLDGYFFISRPQEYIQRFQKYIFFFIHALNNDSTSIFVIDDVLFECLKSLHRCKTKREDFTLISDLAMLTLVHLRTKAEVKDANNDYRVEPTVLRNIKTYVLNFPGIENAEIDIEVKTDYLHGWMLLRTGDTCFEMCYSMGERKYILNFLDRILCSILCPDDEPIKHIVFYNAYLGQESRIAMPRNIGELREFVRFSNNYDFSQQEPNDEFLTRDLEGYFENLAH